MFYARINKIKVFNNREGFLGLFNSAELRICSYAVNLTNMSGHIIEKGVCEPRLTMDDLIYLDDDERSEKLLEAVLTESEHLAQSHRLEINGVKDNQSLLFGDAGLVIYESEHIPDSLNLQLWVIESDADVRRFALDAETVLNSDAFKGLLTAVSAALTVTNPILTGAVAVGSVAVNLLRQKLKANKDDLVGYWQATLHREEDYPHGQRDRQGTPDTTGNILVDYTLFGFDNTVYETESSAASQPSAESEPPVETRRATSLQTPAPVAPVTPPQPSAPSGKPVEYLIIHCTATPPGREVTAADIRRWHTSPVSEGGRGWKQVGYTDMIHLDGTVERLVPNNEDNIVDTWEITNGVKGINSVSRHVVYAGGTDAQGKPADTRTPAQHEALRRYVADFRARFPQAQVKGHYEFANKACPSFNVEEWLKTSEL